ncbi:MAG: acyltransferase [Anaerolineales bacterium]|nr:acyltransferase [Anaerolineales bacterium]
MNIRANWVDYGKGIGIILVVYAHLLSSAYHGGIQVPEYFFKLSDSIVYSFHMPLFFFLSGLFVEGSLNKRGVKNYLKDKFLRIFYPYIVWSILQVSVEVMFSGQTQNGATISDLFAVIHQPWGQFWFLYALLLMHIVYAILSYLGKYAKVMALLVAALLFLNWLPIGAFGIFGFSAHFIFFTGGIIFREQFMKAEKYAVPLWSILLLAAVLIGSGYYLFSNLISPIRLVSSPYLYHFLTLSILGIITCSLAAHYLARHNLAPFLQTLGEYSLQIYLVHMLAGVGIRMALLTIFGVENWVIHIIVGTTFALVSPIVLQKISDRLNFPYLFELKKREA